MKYYIDGKPVTKKEFQAYSLRKERMKEPQKTNTQIKFCSVKGCGELATTKLTQDGKHYCDKHAVEEVGNYFSAIPRFL